MLLKRIHISQVRGGPAHLSLVETNALEPLVLYNFKPVIDKELEFSLYLSVLEAIEHSR